MSKDSASKEATTAPREREAAVQVVVRLRPQAGVPSDDFSINTVDKV